MDRWERCSSNVRVVWKSGPSQRFDPSGDFITTLGDFFQVDIESIYRAIYQDSIRTLNL